MRREIYLRFLCLVEQNQTTVMNTLQVIQIPHYESVILLSSTLSRARGPGTTSANQEALDLAPPHQASLGATCIIHRTPCTQLMIFYRNDLFIHLVTHALFSPVGSPQETTSYSSSHRRGQAESSRRPAATELKCIFKLRGF